MKGHTGDYCLHRNKDGRLRRVTRNGVVMDVFPMNTAVIAYDSHSNYVVYTLMYEALIRGKGTEAEAINKAREMQSNVEIEWERLRYITRSGVFITDKKDVHIIGQ